MTTNTEATIWERTIEANAADLSPDAARSLLRIRFKESDQERMASLAARARDGTLSPDEQLEAEEYRRVADLMALMQSKARRSLTRAGLSA